MKCFFILSEAATGDVPLKKVLKKYFTEKHLCWSEILINIFLEEHV